MISVEAWTTIRYLKAQGRGIKAIARELKVSRNTVRRAVSEESPPRYERVPQPNPRLDPFRGAIREMLVEKKFIGTRILRELRGMGYEGSQTTFYRYLAKVKAEVGKGKACMRYETSPGWQGQFDWSPYTVELGGSLSRTVVFCLTLGYSRRKHYWPSLDGTQASVFQALEEGLWHFGGSPKELLVDRDRSLVLDPSPHHLQWNPRFLELCGHYGIRPIPAWDARVKGKVERPFFYLEEHFIKGRSFRSFDHFCQELARFEAEELDLQVHHTTGERPIDRFERDKAAFTPLPSSRFRSSREEFRKVSWDCLIPFAGNRYSVPSPYAGKQVWVRTSQGSWLQVYDQQGRLIAQHPLNRQKGVTVIQEEHYDGLRKRAPRTRVLLEKVFLEKFPGEGRFLDRLYAQQKYNGVAHLRAILELAETYSQEALLRAFALAHTYNTYSHHFVRGLVEKELPPPAPVQPGPISLWGVPEVRVARDLSVYQRVLEIEEAGR